MAYIETPDGVPLYYEERGEGETLLLVHGWTMNAEYWWQKNVETLADDHYVVTVDLRGHGLSGKTDENHTLEEYARDIRHFVQSLEFDDVTAVGWSMGAAVLLTYLDQFGSDRLRAVGFVDQSPRLLSEENWEHPVFGGFTPEALEEVVETIQSARPDFAKQFISDMFADPPSAETVDEMYAETMKTPTSVATAVLRDLVNSDRRDVVPEIDVPTLLLYGEQSEIYPSDVGAWMHDRISDSELVMFSESGHVPFWEEPDAFNEAVSSFVEQSSDRDA
ncbi:alpha/beta hydrolase [Natronococcus pandeyae]|uniref:Alpha/beta hydrolase n=1 Tax=Natronococcus pandeyae TaxID=2055836 RepID=A0A8J8Q2C5_9EURY|nr:alpha/beta hydrolase [Natronococcus pandeyae]TYL39131.1 alpha/beta hydrolase [Natronococcus pandeyae]